MSFAETQTDVAHASVSDRESTMTGLQILFVEDDDADAYLIERALLANPDVGGLVRAADGVEALYLVETGAVTPDLAFIDLHMPRKSGFHLLVDFAVRRGTCFPMVVLTSSTEPADAMRSRLRGAVRVLTKPDSATELEAILAAAVTSARSGITLPKRGPTAPKRRTAFDNTPPRAKRTKAPSPR